MPKLNVDLFKRLCETPGVPGREERVRDLIVGEIGPAGEGLFDEVRTDAMGNLICRRAPRQEGAQGGRRAAAPRHALVPYG